MPLKTFCLVCRKLIPGRSGGRCAEHRLKRRKRTDSPSSRASADPRERARRQAAVAAHRREHGDFCFGVPERGRPPHEVVWPNILTAHHPLPVADYGYGPDAVLVVICRKCNSAANGGRRLR